MTKLGGVGRLSDLKEIGEVLFLELLLKLLLNTLGGVRLGRWKMKEGGTCLRGSSRNRPAAMRTSTTSTSSCQTWEISFV